MHCIIALHQHIFGPFGHDSDFITVDKLGALYSSFILKLCIQIANLRGKISGSSKIYFKTESELFLVLNEFPILGENNDERSQIKNIQSSLSLSEAIFYITDKEKNNANWITNASEHVTITSEGSIFCKLKRIKYLEMVLVKYHKVNFLAASRGRDLLKDSVAKIKLAQQKIAKIIFVDLSRFPDLVRSHSKPKIDAPTSNIEQQIRKAIFHRLSVIFGSSHLIKKSFTIFFSLPP